MNPANLLTLNHTFDRNSMSWQYPQTKSYQSRTDIYAMSSSLRAIDGKTKAMRMRFAFIQRNYSLDGRENETVATVLELSDLWKSGATDGVPPFVMDCICFQEQLFALVVWFLLFADAMFEIFLYILLFCSFFWWFCAGRRRSSTTSM